MNATETHTQYEFDQDILNGMDPVPAPSPLGNGLCLYLEGDDVSPSVFEIPNLISTLRDLATLYHDTQHWTEEFVAACCHKPTVKGPTNDRCELLLREISPSEKYRIHRALWRFWLLCELAYPRDAHEARGRRCLSADHAETFLKQFSLWEFKEMECIMRFLWDEFARLIDIYKDSHDEEEDSAPQVFEICQLPSILQRLLDTRGYNCEQVAPFTLEEEDEDHLDGRSLTSRLFFWIRVRIASDQAHTKRWKDAPLDVALPNYGRAYYVTFSDNDRFYPASWKLPPDAGFLYPNCLDDERGPVTCFLRWGYCIWDRRTAERMGHAG
ncbi:MAG: hypothetical protein Q9218_002818 [Villophora microphyllina]